MSIAAASDSGEEIGGPNVTWLLLKVGPLTPSALRPELVRGRDAVEHFFYGVGVFRSGAGE